MEHHNHFHGKIGLVIWLASSIIGWISSIRLEVMLRDVSLGVSIIAGIVTIRYYWYATKEKKSISSKKRNHNHKI